MDLLHLEQALFALGELLKERNLHFEVVAIGGGSLLLMRLHKRPTKDLDLVAFFKDGGLLEANPIPEDLLKAVQEVGFALNLGKDWLNFGPASLMQFGLPEGFVDRMETKKFGGLIVHLSSRFDQICFKTYAAVDHGPESKHFTDLLTLNPIKEELERAKKWCLIHDASEAFSTQLDEMLGVIYATIE